MFSNTQVLNKHLLLAQTPVRLSSLVGFVIKLEAVSCAAEVSHELSALSQGFVSPSLEFGSYTLRQVQRQVVMKLTFAFGFFAAITVAGDVSAVRFPEN